MEVEPPVTIEQEEEEPKVSQKEVIGTNQVQNLRANQIRKLLGLIKKVICSDEILQLENLEDLIRNALSQSKKKLARESDGAFGISGITALPFPGRRTLR